jgi:thymidylate synthase
MVTVVKLDMYLWARFTCEMAEDLGIEPGRFSSTIVSAHVFERDQKYLQSLKILD